MPHEEAELGEGGAMENALRIEGVPKSKVYEVDRLARALEYCVRAAERKK